MRTNALGVNTYTADTNGTTFNSDDVLRLGADYDGGERLNGRMDEVRVHSTARSDNYLTTRYNNMNSPSTFWSVGSSTAQGAIATTTYTENYTYNAIGNLTNKSDVGAYVYAGTNYTNPYAPTSVNGSTITYDNNGNLTSDGIWTNTWDYRNRLTQSSKGTATSTYAYDQQDNRVKLTEGSVTTLFPNKLYSVMLGGSATTTKHIFASDLLLSTITSGATASSTAATTSVIYSDSLDANWSDWSFGTTNTLNSTGTVFSGTSAIKTVYMGAWDGLYLHHAGLSTNTSTHLHFSFYATSSSPFLQILAYNLTGNPMGTAALSTYVPTIVANTWYTVDIPLSALGATATTTTGFVFQKDTSGTVYYDDMRLVTIATASAIKYVHTDHLGSTNVITDQNGSNVETLDYYPYGATRVDTTVSYAGEKRAYAGTERDTTAGLNYMMARYQSPTRGQFLSQDPVFWEIGQSNDGKSVLTNPQLQNSYSYAGNNPIINKDPSGRFIDVPWISNNQWVQEGAAGLYNQSGIWQTAMNYPNTTGAIVGVGAAAAAYGAAAAATALSVQYFGGAGTACVALCNQNGQKLVEQGVSNLQQMPRVAEASEKMVERGPNKGIVGINNFIQQAQKGTAYLDNKTGNINIFSNIENTGKYTRTTLNPERTRIISAGFNQARNVINGISKGRFTEIGR